MSCQLRVAVVVGKFEVSVVRDDRGRAAFMVDAGLIEPCLSADLEPKDLADALEWLACHARLLAQEGEPPPV